MAMARSIHVLFLILVLLVLESASLASDFSSLSHADECSLLFQFKESMSINTSVSTYDSHAYPKVASWNLNGSDGVGNCCLWDGVECGFGHVIGLDLSSSFLSGPISSNNSLFNLIHLRTLNLANNDFRSSQIPSGIGRLSQLTNLNMSYSFFSGEVPKQISQLRNLVSLDLRGNYSPRLKMQSSDFQNLVQNTSETLRELFLSWVNIDFVPDSLVNSSSLTSLVMSFCGLSGDFPTGILYLQKLQVLDLQVNDNLTGYIPEFHGNSELKQLIVAQTNFQGSIPASIGNLTHLNVLVLRSNAFTGTLPASVSNLTQLTHLDLSFNKLTGNLPSLQSLSNLTYLSLRENNFDRWKLPDWFGKLNKITYLNLAYVNLYGEIPSSLFNLTQLECLFLDGNQLKGELPISLLNLQNLETFYLDGNITVDFYLFLSLKKLENLYLNGNNISLSVIDSHTNETQPKFKELGLTSCNLKVFPEFLRFQHQLEHLNLDNNNIEGLIPGWMWNISKETLIELSLAHNLLMGFEQHSPVASWVSLQNLDLSHNMLHGSIPVPPPSTIMYDVSNNNLTGEISQSICDLSSLQLLDLSFNNITGSIPPCLEKLSNTSMTVLNLRSNTLQGKIPNIFTSESKLEMIDLSENKLEGHVPRSLENCESLRLLDLGYNFLEGTFPFWLGALSELQVLILRFNKFHGVIRIPGNIKVNFPKLRIIDLSNNLFSGDLPHKYFQEWSAMKETMANTIYMQTSIEEHREEYTTYISYEFSFHMTTKGVKIYYEKISEAFFVVDLSGNMFRGNIPESITTLSGLQLLNLSNNELSGVIPPSMGNLTSLESLDLSSNKLSGVIPQDLVRLNFLAVLNVSNNNLTGPIPHGKQFDTFSNNSYMGNRALRGFPLSMYSGDSEASKPPKVSFEEDPESDFPNGIDWVVILIGVVTGLVIGLVYGDYLSTKYYRWFSQRSRR
ncbi:putative leucine-rich repeat domain superfamily [Helianthus annuus]|nr:putative leucine-rich repeat domain superfamily [Helianthus annuus]